MNYIDIILGLLLVFSAISGFRKGLIYELASLAALIFGIWGAIEFSDLTSGFLVENLNFHTKYLNIISFILTFAIIVILVHFTANVINKLVETVMLGFINRLAGMAFGVLRAALILSIILVVFDKIDEDTEMLSKEIKSESKLYAPIRNFAPAIFPFIDIWQNETDTGKENHKRII